jgi:hypothetical protein
MEKTEDKKNSSNIGVIAIFLLIVIFGFLYLKKGQIPKNNSNQTNQVKNSNQQTSKNSIVESIKEAIGKNISFKCQFQPEGTNKIVTMYFKGGKIRSEYLSGNEIESVAIVDNNKMWNWQPKEKKGVVFSIDLFKGKTTSENQSFDQEEMIKQAEKYRQKCKVENLPNSLFEPDKNIQYQDMDEIMKQMMGK